MHRFILFSKNGKTKGDWKDPMKAGRMDIIFHSIISTLFLPYRIRVKRIILAIFLLLMIVSISYGEVAQRTREICDDLNLKNGVYFFPINKTFTNPSEVQAIFIESLNFERFNKVNHPLDYYNYECEGIPLTCNYNQLGITITSGQGITINCSHEGPTNEEAKALWLKQHKQEIIKQQISKMIGFVFIVIFIIITAVILYKTNRKRYDEYEKKIMLWLNYNLQKGYDIETLKKYLINSGYKKEVIQRIIRNLK